MQKNGKVSFLPSYHKWKEQSKDSQPSVNIHECSICKNKSTWNDNWSWKYLLIKDYDEIVVKICSSQCKQRAKKIGKWVISRKQWLDKGSDLNAFFENLDNEQGKIMKIEEKNYTEALNLIKVHQKASCSFFQRHLKITSSEAMEIMEKLEEEGYISQVKNCETKTINKKINKI